MRNICMSALIVMSMVGCSETGLQGDEDPNLIGNPPPVGGEAVVDNFVQASGTQADVLFVISNWWSMEQAYAELIDTFDDLLEVLVGSGVDYHIGVISTDTDHAGEKGHLHAAANGAKWIQTDTDLPIDTFAQMAVMDASGCVGPRRPRDATFLALEEHVDGWNAGFRREEASMHTVFVSDERDLSTMLAFDEWVQWYSNFTQTPEIDTLSTIVDFSSDTQNLAATAEIGGASHPISEMPWMNIIQEIGLRAQGMRQEFFLSRQPIPETIVVSMTVDGANITFTEGTPEEGGDYSYDEMRNSVQLHDMEPPEGANISVAYEAL